MAVANTPVEADAAVANTIAGVAENARRPVRKVRIDEDEDAVDSVPSDLHLDSPILRSRQTPDRNEDSREPKSPVATPIKPIYEAGQDDMDVETPPGRPVSRTSSVNTSSKRRPSKAKTTRTMKAKSRAVNMWDFTPGKKRVADVSTSSSHGMDTRGRKKKKSIVESPSNYSSTSAEDGSLSSGDLISDDELNERLAPVTADERKLYNSITAVTKSHEESEKIVLEFAHDKLKVKAKDMHRLSPNEWVDDLIIDTFGALINKRNSDFFSENTHAVDKSFLPISNSTKSEKMDGN